jgi:hypothetical protein
MGEVENAGPSVDDDKALRSKRIQGAHPCAEKSKPNYFGHGAVNLPAFG